MGLKKYRGSWTSIVICAFFPSLVLVLSLNIDSSVHSYKASLHHFAIYNFLIILLGVITIYFTQILKIDDDFIYPYPFLGGKIKWADINKIEVDRKLKIVCFFYGDNKKNGFNLKLIKDSNDFFNRVEFESSKHKIDIVKVNKKKRMIRGSLILALVFGFMIYELYGK